LDTWRRAVQRDLAAHGQDLVDRIRDRLADDLDTEAAISAVDRWAADTLERRQSAAEAQSPVLVRNALDALLGIRL
jgi:L-cysteine:1D-myo-inositol 2-amino-2-deoxy-alpha-D-glucopyranoside ligase